MKIQFKDWKPKPPTLATLKIANEIIEEFQAQGYALTTRQLYYQFVARGFIDNNAKAYARIKNLVSEARLAGIISWDAIVDRTRTPVKRPEWEDLPAFLRSILPQYKHSLWEGQDAYVEVWVEKEALAGVIERFTYARGITSFACRGYPSASSIFEASQRIRREVLDYSGSEVE